MKLFVALVREKERFLEESRLKSNCQFIGARDVTPKPLALSSSFAVYLIFACCISAGQCLLILVLLVLVVGVSKFKNDSFRTINH